MLRLTSPAQATLIHGITGQEVEDVTLPAGTEYTIEGVRDGMTTRWVTVLVPDDGPLGTRGWYRYRLREQDLSGEQV